MMICAFSLVELGLCLRRQLAKIEFTDLPISLGFPPVSPTSSHRLKTYILG